MRATAIALSTLLCACLLNASAAKAADGSMDVRATAATTMPYGLLQVAESNTKSPNKGADKYMSGQGGGRYGIGGSEPKVKYFNAKMKKIPRCCVASK
jgi:hypothetical protein